MITRANIAEMMDLISAAYGDKTFPEDSQKFGKVVNLWTTMFQDDEPGEVLLAVKNCIATLQFPPKIADIKSRIAEIRMAGKMTEMHAWSQIRKAVRKSGTRQDANHAFMELPNILREVVDEPSMLMAWNGVSNDTLEGVIASNVMRSYREIVKNKVTYNSLPRDIQPAHSWLSPEPGNVEMLPEPAPQKSFEERDAEMDRQAAEYRSKYLSAENPDMAQRVKDFVAPLTENEQKQYEAKAKHDFQMLLQRMSPRDNGER